MAGTEDVVAGDAVAGAWQPRSIGEDTAQEIMAFNAGAYGRRPPAPPRRRRRRFLPWKHKRDLDPVRRRRRRLIVRTAWTAVLVFFATIGWSIGQALLAPGTDSVQARLAEWGRDHNLGSVVTALENWQYKSHPPKVGGTLSAQEQAQMRAGATVQKPAVKRGAAQPDVSILPPISPVVTPALAGEGVWHPLVVEHGLPIIQAAYLRPDTEHTSYEAAVAWISQKHTKYVLHPGFSEPGGSFDQPSSISDSERSGLIASWNGGFKVSNGDSRGGFFLDGKLDHQLQNGAASEVFYRDGSIKIGQWGRDISMTSDVVGVRQCLTLLVDGGKVVDGIGVNAQQKWGYTDKGAQFVERSGVGVTAQGDIVYVAGQALSAPTLADLLQRAGAVRAMTLDINLLWPSFMTYDGSSSPSDPKPTNLLDFMRTATRYYTASSRDFVAVYTR